MKRRWAALAALGVVAMVAGCGSAAPSTPKGPAVLRADVARLAPGADAPVDDLVSGIEQFGYDLAPAGAASNWVASPTSIALVLSMLRGGAAGPTAAEIDQTFGFPSDVHEAFNALSRQLITVERPPSTKDEPTRQPGELARPSVVAVGNAIFPAQGFPIEDGYLRLLAEQYGTGVYPVDFHQPTAKDAIDEWARDLTAGRIQKVFDQIDPDTAAVIANTVYFKGEWRSPFDAAMTTDQTFRRADGQTVTVPTMADQLQVGYAQGPGWQAVELPYGQDGAFAMRVFLPTGELNPRDLLAPTVQAGAIFSTKMVDIRLPRWNFAADVPLKDELIRLGVVSAFDAERADFSGMSTVALYVADAIHRATITVDEAGSEAAAVTAAAMAPTSGSIEPPVAFHADHPFAFAIVHTATGAPLFYGMVADPSAT